MKNKGIQLHGIKLQPKAYKIRILLHINNYSKTLNSSWKPREFKP